MFSSTFHVLSRKFGLLFLQGSTEVQQYIQKEQQKQRGFLISFRLILKPASNSQETQTWEIALGELIGMKSRRVFCVYSASASEVGTHAPFRATLLENQSKFPRYNMKCRGKHNTTRNFVRSISFSRYISCYIAESRLPLGQCTVLTASRQNQNGSRAAQQRETYSKKSVTAKIASEKELEFSQYPNIPFHSILYPLVTQRQGKLPASLHTG